MSDNPPDDGLPAQPEEPQIPLAPDEPTAPLPPAAAGEAWAAPGASLPPEQQTAWQPPPLQPGQQYAPPPQPRKGLSFGAGIGIGVAIGFAAQILALVLLAVTGGLAGGGGPWWLIFWPFMAVTIVAIVLMFFPKPRSFATGILIISAAAWLVAVGPCMALIGWNQV